jgi:hypothetical protein
MALISCHECGNQVSDNARACPKCGAPVIMRIRRELEDQAGYVSNWDCFCHNRGLCRLADNAQLAAEDFRPFTTSMNKSEQWTMHGGLTQISAFCFRIFRFVMMLTQPDFGRTIAPSLTTGFTMIYLERVMTEGYARFTGDPNNYLQPVRKEALIGAIKKMNRCSHRPSPAGGGILVAPAEKIFKLRAGVARPSPAAGAGGISPPVPSPGGTPGQPAGGTPALQGSRRTMPRRRRWGALN